MEAEVVVPVAIAGLTSGPLRCCKVTEGIQGSQHRVHRSRGIGLCTCRGGGIHGAQHTQRALVCEGRHLRGDRQDCHCSYLDIGDRVCRQLVRILSERRETARPGGHAVQVNVVSGQHSEQSLDELPAHPLAPLQVLGGGVTSASTEAFIASADGVAGGVIHCALNDRLPAVDVDSYAFTVVRAAIGTHLGCDSAHT